MSLIQFETDEIRKLCEHVVPNTKLVTCTAAEPAPLVRVDIKEDEANSQLTVCLRFPEGYPATPILVELKSRTLSDRFLNGLTTQCEAQARKHLGKPQGLNVLRFAQHFLSENPLCVCIDEIHQLRHDIGGQRPQEQLKLKQKTSSVTLTAHGGNYFYRVRAIIPHDYPQGCVELKDVETNLPAVLERYLNGQSREIARQCVEPPMRLAKDKQALAAFKPAPSLHRTLKFCLEATRDFNSELCPICDETVLPANPQDVVLDESKDAFVERVYCGHLFHQGCLRQYLQQPPFPKDGKLCPAKRRHARSDARFYLGGARGRQPKEIPKDTGGICGIRLAHDRWVVNIKLAESRWAQKQARERELQEVIDFLS